MLNMKINPLIQAIIFSLPVVSFIAQADEVNPKKQPGMSSNSSENNIGETAAKYLAAHPEKIGEAVSVYLAEHPEFLLAAQENLRQRQEQAQQQAMLQMTVLHQGDLLASDSPSVGPADASVAVVMFFDYQCPACSRIAPDIKATIKANPKVRFVFKELPVLANRWPVSGLAARVGEKIWKDKGGEAYLTYHDALFATGHTEGAMTTEDVHRAAGPYLSAGGLKAQEKTGTDSPEIQSLNRTGQLAQQLGVTGTPAFVVLPQAPGVDAARISVFSGNVTPDALQAAIMKADGK